LAGKYILNTISVDYMAYDHDLSGIY